MFAEEPQLRRAFPGGPKVALPTLALASALIAAPADSAFDGSGRLIIKDPTGDVQAIGNSEPPDGRDSIDIRSVIYKKARSLSLPGLRTTVNVQELHPAKEPSTRQTFTVAFKVKGVSVVAAFKVGTATTILREGQTTRCNSASASADFQADRLTAFVSYRCLEGKPTAAKTVTFFSDKTEETFYGIDSTQRTSLRTLT